MPAGIMPETGQIKFGTCLQKVSFKILAPEES
jgi:hypothetical protein